MTTPEGERVDPDLISRFDDEEFMTKLGGLLELPAEWLVLRARSFRHCPPAQDTERAECSEGRQLNVPSDGGISPPLFSTTRSK